MDIIYWECKSTYLTLTNMNQDWQGELTHTVVYLHYGAKLCCVNVTVMHRNIKVLNKYKQGRMNTILLN